MGLGAAQIAAPRAIWRSSPTGPAGGHTAGVVEACHSWLNRTARAQRTGLQTGARRDPEPRQHSLAAA
jgi:hypothetical protein